MIKLASGDMMRFEIGGGKALLQVIGRADAPRIEKSGYGWLDGDNVSMTGSDVALLLHRLSTADADGYVTPKVPVLSKLRVSTLHDELGKVTVVLETDNNEIHMKAYERDMFVSAIESQVWRLFS